MKINNKGAFLSGLAVLCLLMFSVTQAADRPWERGAVVEVTAVKIKPGQFINYMNHLNGPYRAINEEAKKQGLILDFGMFATEARSPDEPDLYLTVTYPNRTSMENPDNDGKWEAIVAKVGLGDDEAQSKSAMDRESMRTILGSETIRELVWKADKK